MKNFIKNTARELGQELMNAFFEMYGDDLMFMEEVIEEALYAFRYAKEDLNLEEVLMMEEYFDEAA